MTFDAAGQPPADAFAHVDRIRLVFHLQYYKEASTGGLDPRMFDMDAMAHCGKPVCNLPPMSDGEISLAECLDPDPCAAAPCANGGGCNRQHGHPNGFVCECPLVGDFKNDRCEARDPCLENNGGCGDFGRCAMLVPGLATCTCQPGYSTAPGGGGQCVSDIPFALNASVGQNNASFALPLCNGTDPADCASHANDCDSELIGGHLAEHCPVMCNMCRGGCNGKPDPTSCASHADDCSSSIVGEKMRLYCPDTCGMCLPSSGNATSSSEDDGGETSSSENDGDDVVLAVVLTLLVVGLLAGAAAFVVRKRGAEARGGESTGKHRTKFASMENEAYDQSLPAQAQDGQPLYDTASNTGYVAGSQTVGDATLDATSI